MRSFIKEIFWIFWGIKLLGKSIVTDIFCTICGFVAAFWIVISVENKNTWFIILAVLYVATFLILHFSKHVYKYLCPNGNICAYGYRCHEICPYSDVRRPSKDDLDANKYSFVTKFTIASEMFCYAIVIAYLLLTYV